MLLTHPPSPDPDLAALRRVLSANPDLSWRGWWTDWDAAHEPPGTLARLRQQTLTEYGVSQFSRAIGFLEGAPRTKQVNRHHTSYGWKHRAEARVSAINECCRPGDRPRYRHCYVGDGAFIAACLASGLIIERRGRATYVNLSLRAWHRDRPSSSVLGRSVSRWTVRDNRRTVS